jgi:hypothetical protein
MTEYTFQGFNHSTRRNMEGCALSNKEIQDKKFSSYRTANFNDNDRNGYMKSLDYVGISASKNKDGYAKMIDMESKLKQSSITNYKDKQQLQSREFKGSPYMGAGQTHIVNPVLYSKLVSGNDTRVKKAADTLAGVSIDRFIPLVPCLQDNIQNPEHIIPQYWVRGGESSRAHIQNIDYYKLCGIEKQ